MWADTAGDAKTYTSAPDFLDTNILVYAYDRSDRSKQLIARELVRKARSGGAVLSTQVLTEFAVTLIHKVTPPAPAKDVLALLDVLGPIRTIATDAELVRRAVEARFEYGIHFYDGMIVAAAERLRCAKILSEDFNSGQKYFGIAVQNRFA